MVEQRYKEAFVEVLGVLQYMEKDAMDKVPKKLIRFFEENASQTYISNIDYSQEMDDMNLKRETLALLAMIYRNYWCTPEERAEYDKMLDENERKYQEELCEKYNPDNMFKKAEMEQEQKPDIQPEQTNENLPIEVKKETFYQKIVNFIKSFFMKK